MRPPHRVFSSRRFVRIALTSLLALPLLWLTAHPWGTVGHRFINTKAVYHLSPDMSTFIGDSTFFGAHASDADNRKSTDPNEAPKHFIDIDSYPDYHHLPHSYDSVVALYGPSTVIANGVLPWATVTAYDSLVAQLSRADWATAVLTASDLGHYIGDGHQPLHVTANYDGQQTGNNGIHSRYESQMLSSSNYGNALFITPDSAVYIAKRLDFVFSYLLANNSLIDSIFHADTYAKGVSGWSGSGTAPAAYYAALWSRVGGMTLDLMQHATVSLASFWKSAWVDAGLLQVNGVARGPDVVTSFHLEQNFPNPFNPATTIRYNLPVGGTVRLTVYASDGREVATLVDAVQGPGSHEVRFDGGGRASGLYLCELRLGRFVEVRKMVLVR